MLRVSVTDRCNFRCLYCMPAEGVEPISHQQVLRYEEIVEVVRAAAEVGISAVKITGGEPLVRRDVPALVAMLRRLPGLNDLSMTTNGSLLSRDADELGRAGLNRITVSLDTLQPDKFRRITRGGELARVWDGIDAARRAGLGPIKINVVAMRGINDDEFLDFARLTIQHDLAVRFIELMPIGRTALADAQQWIGEPQIRRTIASLGPLSPAEPGPGVGPARLYRLRGARGKIGFISAISSPFCAGCNRLRLTADGHLRACLFDGHEISIAHLLRPAVDRPAVRRALLECIQAKPQVHGPVGAAQMSRVGG